MKSQLEGSKTICERLASGVILCGEICNTLAIIVACFILYLLTWPFNTD